MAQYPVTGMSKVTGDIGLGTASFAPVEYSPETQAYLKAIADAAAGRNPGIGNYYSGLQSSGEMVNSDVTLPVYNTEDAFKPYLGLPVDDNLGYQFMLDGKWGSTGQVSVGNKTPIYLVDDKTGKVVSSGIGFASAEQIAQQAKDLGAGHAWSIYTGGPPGVGNRAAQNEPQMGALEGIGQLIKTVGPVVAAGGLAPLFASAAEAAGGLGGVLQSVGPLVSRGLTTAGITALGDTVAGRNIGDILKNAGVAGVKAMALYKLGDLTGINKLLAEAGQPSIQTAGTGPLGTPTFAETAGALANYTSSIPGFAQVPGAFSSSFPSSSSQGTTELPNDGNITITAPALTSVNPVLPVIGAGALGAGAIVGGSGGAGTAGTAGTTTGTTATTTTAPPGTPPTVQPVQVGPLGTPTGAATAADLATATGTATLPAAHATGILGSTLGLTAAQEAAISTALKAAGLGLTVADLLGIGGGGGGSGGAGTIPGGLGTGGFSPLFSAAGPRFRPADTGAARTASDLAARGLSTPEDYYRYASGPAQSFHTGVQPGAMNSNRPFTGYPVAIDRPMVVNTGGNSDRRVAATDRPETVDFAVGGPIKAPSVDAKEHRLGPLPGYRVSEERRPRGRINGNERYISYDGDIPIGRGSLSVRAGGRGLAPEDFSLGAEYPVGDAMLYAEDMLGAPSFGVRLPIGDATLDASAGGRRRQGFADRGRLRVRVPFEGGGYAVGGSGDGRDDKIPAMLSDGEYVVDAETVALLGNGSSKAGADALDRFRVSVRKHKGRELAKGSFSAKAKKPEQYLKRGRK